MSKLQVPDFSISERVTEEQFRYFDKYGLIVFRNFIPQETVASFLNEIKRIEKQWLDEGVEKVNGIPLKFGKDEHGNKTIQRLCFTSLYSPILHNFLSDP